MLGVTTTQLQAMEHAAEEAGVSTEQLFRAAEKLTQSLAEARAGSTKAIDTMHSLGVTNDQLADKSFTNVDLLAQLSARLNDAGTASQTMAALTKELGARAAVAAEAIKNLKENTAEWAQVIAAIGGPTDAQTKALKEQAIQYHEIQNARRKREDAARAPVHDDIEPAENRVRTVPARSSGLWCKAHGNSDGDRKATTRSGWPKREG